MQRFWQRFWQPLSLTCAIAVFLSGLGELPGGGRAIATASTFSGSDVAASVTAQASVLPLQQASSPRSPQPRPSADDDPANAVASVTLDGNVLFEVGTTQRFSAEERVAAIEEGLEAAVADPRRERVTIDTEEELPQIVLKRGSEELYIATVTDIDAQVGGTDSPLAQAGVWKQEIEDALARADEERGNAFLRRALVEVAIVLTLTLLFHEGMPKLMARVSDRFSVSPAWQSLSASLLRLLLWTVALVYIGNLFPLTREWLYELRQAVANSITASILPIGERAYSLLDLLILIALLLGLVVGSNRLSQLLRLRVLQVSRLNRAAQDAIATTLKYALMVVGSVVVFNIWGLDITSLTILAGALSVGIGFGFQDIAKNLGSGLVLLFERPIQVGDFIEIGEYVGTVERIGSRSTLIRTLDRVSIIVPNSRFLETEVINWSHDNPISRLRVPLGVAYGSDLSTVKSALLEAGQKHPQVLRIPPPRVLFVGFGDSSLDFELLVWCADPSQQYLLKSDLYFTIEAQLNAVGVEIPFPQRDLHVRSGTLPVTLSPQMEQMLGRLLERLVK